MRVLSKFDKHKIIFKIHPRKNDPYYLKILKNYKNIDYEISNKNLLQLTNKCEIFLHDRHSSVLHEGLVFGKTSIEYWDEMKIYNFITANDMLKLNVKANNQDELEKLIKLAIEEPSHEIWIKQKSNYKLNCKKYGENATKKCIDTIYNLIENN